MMQTLPVLETPTFVGKILSTGKPFEFRPFLVKEQKNLMIAIDSKKISQIYVAFRNIIDACCISNVDSTSLYVFDAEAIFVQISSKSIGEISKISMECEHCRARNDVSLNLEKIRLINAKNTAKKKIMLTESVGVVMKFPLLSEFVSQIVETDGKNQEMTGQELAQSSYSELKVLIESVFDKDNVYPIHETSDEEFERFIDSLSIQQFKQIQDFIGDAPYLAIDCDFKCKACSQENHIEIRGMQNFF